MVGSRDYPDLDEVREFIRPLSKDTVIVTGGARGVDRAAEEEAKAQGLRIKVHKAEWWKHGKSAGFIRNQEIVNDCDKLQAFWDGESPGTRGTIALAKKAEKLLGVRRKRETPQMDLFGND